MKDLSTKGFYPIHEGVRYNVETGIEHYYTDASWSRGILEVRIIDTKTGKEYKRRGTSMMMGNFCPVFVTIKGIEYTTEEILKKEGDF